ncbi:MAG: [FeFe] hydrogenase H-cluster radical SAM maturase HydG [Thermodesulfobacteriota bacterium]
MFKNKQKISDVINEEEIAGIISSSAKSLPQEIREILKKAHGMNGLTLKEAASLLSVTDEGLGLEINEAAGRVKRRVYGDRLVLFAPLYTSSHCVNDCAYCGFRRSNNLDRVRLTIDEVREETEALIEMGHKRVLLESGEDPLLNDIDYTLEAIEAIYSVKPGSGEIRRVNVNIAATSVDNYRRLKAASIGTYQLFQETYHRATYESLHSGPKADYERQLFAHDRAFEAGIDDVGLGALFGLYDYRFETLALLSHARYLESKFNVGPHTFSVPRLRPATGAKVDTRYAVTDSELLRVIAVLRLAVPYTGMIISTRESAGLRSLAFEIGISQASACSKARPGGYTKKEGRSERGQFEVGDTRAMDVFLRQTLDEGLLPSFCTACYRRGRTGEAFMKLARPGDIHHLCSPNALLTFKEYLEDFAPGDIKLKGESVIEKYLGEIEDPLLRDETREGLKRIEGGVRDIYF